MFRQLKREMKQSKSLRRAYETYSMTRCREQTGLCVSALCEPRLVGAYPSQEPSLAQPTQPRHRHRQVQNPPQVSPSPVGHTPVKPHHSAHFYAFYCSVGDYTSPVMYSFLEPHCLRGSYPHSVDILLEHRIREGRTLGHTVQSRGSHS